MHKFIEFCYLSWYYIDQGVGVLGVVKVWSNLAINSVVYWTAEVMQCVFMLNIYNWRACAMLLGAGRVWPSAGWMTTQKVSLWPKTRSSWCRFGCVEEVPSVVRTLTQMHDMRYWHSKYIAVYNGFGGLEVACWPLVPKFAGSNPAEAVGFLGRKIP